MYYLLRARVLLFTLLAGLASVTAVAQSVSNWSNLSHGLTGYGPLVGVAYGNGIFVANEGTTNGTVRYATSTDGTTWTTAGGTLPAATGGTRLYYGNNVWVAYSQFDHRTSTDGTTFTVRGTTSIPIGASPTTVLSDRFVLLANAIYTSTDGITWSAFGALPSVAGFFGLPAVASGGGKLVAAGSINFTSAAILTRDAPAVSAPVTEAPVSQAVTAGGSATLGTTATGTIQWQRNGTSVSGATSGILALTNILSTDAGVYSALITNGGTTTTQSAVLGITTSSKVIGTGQEVGFNITPVPGGNTYDQVLLQGTAATITADANQITRISYIDLSNDIVQVEFSGAGTLSLILDNTSGPAAPANYNQSSVAYMKGHGSIVIIGADETTNVTVFTVGTATAVNQALFRTEVTYDGMADIGFIAIQSPTGKFGGIRAANASFLATKGYTGIYAPGVTFSGPVYVGDINASDTATPVLIIGSAAGETRITGGDLLQSNGAAVTVAGLTQLRFTAGTNSHNVTYPAQSNRAVLRQGSTDVTATIVVNPTP